MKKIGRGFLKFLIGLAFAFVWSLFGVMTGLKQSSYALYGYGMLGFFVLGMWISKRWIGPRPEPGVAPDLDFFRRLEREKIK